MVLEETLRLYPAAWIFSRKAIGDDELGGYHIQRR
jgi:cytochrome P450